MSAVKKVLVCFGNRKRSVDIPDDGENDEKHLRANALKAFQDLLQPEMPIFLQIKDEDWGGEFVDLVDGQVIEDRSVVKCMIATNMATPKTVCPYDVCVHAYRFIIFYTLD